MIKEERKQQLKSVLARVAGVWITLMVPVALLLNVIVGSLSPTTLHRLQEGLPPEAQGMMGQGERLDLSLMTLTYLQHPEAAETAVRFLADQPLPGSQSPRYSEAELAYLVAVKEQVEGLIRWRGWLSGLFLVSLMALFIWPQTGRPAARGLRRGVGLSFFVLVLAILSIPTFWAAFASAFGRLALLPERGALVAADSLVQLFPSPFWEHYAQWLMERLLFWLVGLWLLLLFVRWVIGQVKMGLAVLVAHEVELERQREFETICRESAKQGETVVYRRLSYRCGWAESGSCPGRWEEKGEDEAREGADDEKAEEAEEVEEVEEVDEEDNQRQAADGPSEY